MFQSATHSQKTKSYPFPNKLNVFFPDMYLSERLGLWQMLNQDLLNTFQGNKLLLETMITMFEI